MNLLCVGYAWNYPFSALTIVKKGHEYISTNSFAEWVKSFGKLPNVRYFCSFIVFPCSLISADEECMI